MQDSWFLLYSGTSDEDKMISPGRQVPASMHVYDFLDKDSMVQCEEIRAVSKSRLDAARGCIGTLTPEDFEMVKGKFRRAWKQAPAFPERSFYPRQTYQNKAGTRNPAQADCWHLLYPLRL